MWGRFALTAPADQVAAAFGGDDPPALAARYWSRSPNGGPQPINLRAETVSFKFARLLRERRGLIPAEGLDERRTEGKAKRPSRYTLKTGRPFAFAGLWDVWGAGEDRLLTRRRVTTSVNELVGPVHDRMPVIPPPPRFADRLDPGTP